MPADGASQAYADRETSRKRSFHKSDRVTHRPCRSPTDARAEERELSIVSPEGEGSFDIALAVTDAVMQRPAG